MSSNSFPGINGSMRSYTLTSLEEDSEYNVTIEAINRAGGATSMVLTLRTQASGMLFRGANYLFRVHYLIPNRAVYLEIPAFKQIYPKILLAVL